MVVEQATAVSAYELLHPDVRTWIAKEEWTALRRIQAEAVPVVLRTASDVVIAAPTASGKTEAALLPIASRLIEQGRPGVGCLYIAPLKALINDQFPRAEDLFSRSGIQVMPWHGEIAQSRKDKFLRQPNGILLITPESLEAMMVIRGARIQELFGGLSFVVVDEVHAFAGSERGAQVQSLLNRIERACGRRVQRIGLSATAGDLPAVAEFLRPGAGAAVTIITDSDSPSTMKTVHGIADDGDGETEVVQWMYSNLRGTNNLVFANRRADVESYADALRELCSIEGVRLEFEAHHGSLSRQHREDVERVLKHSSESTTVVASSTLELGIDIGSIERVVQIGAPPSVASLQQRLGRSGRRGEPPVLDTFIIAPVLTETAALEDRLCGELVQTLAAIELMNRRWYEPPVSSALHLSTLVQQILSLVAQMSGLTEEEVFVTVCSAGGPFARTTDEQCGHLIRHLIETDVLYRCESGLLVLGGRGEKLVSGQSFFAAFASSVDYSVFAEDRLLGTLPLTDAIDMGESLTFAARRWRVRKIDDARKKIHLEPSNEPEAAQFLGGTIMVHDEVRREMLRIYMSDATPSYLDEGAVRLLQEGRECFSDLGLVTQRILPAGADAILLPWMGDRAMNTMRLQLVARGLSVKKSALTLRIRKCAVTRLKELLPALRSDDTPLVALARHARTLRVHKHHPRLPPDLLALDYASEFLDVGAASRAWAEIAETL